MSSRRAFLGIGLAGAAVLSGCASTLKPYATRELAAARVRAGDRWRYRVINIYNRQTLSEVEARVIRTEPQLLVTLFDAQGQRIADETWSAPWQVVQEPFYDQVQIFEAPLPLVPFGRANGDTGWLSSPYRLPGQDFPFEWQVRTQAVGWESVSVPAGTYEALRIERDIRFRHPDYWRLSSQRFETLWYAPEVNRWVQREWTGQYRWAGVRSALREDAVRWQLLGYQPAAIA